VDDTTGYVLPIACYTGVMAATNPPQIRPWSMIVLLFWGAVAAAGVSFVAQEVVRGVDGYVNQPDFRTFYSPDKRVSFVYPNGYVTEKTNYGDDLTSTMLSQPRNLRNKTVNPGAAETNPLMFFSEHREVFGAKSAEELFTEEEASLDKSKNYEDEFTVATKEKITGDVDGYPTLQLTYTRVPLKDNGPTYGMTYSLQKQRHTVVLLWAKDRWYRLELSSYVEPREDALVRKVVESLRVHGE
jgi:hypothetical protein